MRYRSKKMQAIYRERRALVARLLSERPWCQGEVIWRCTHRSTEIHEILSRARGGDILDEGNCLALCSNCHRWITEHPAEAKKLGFLKESDH